MREISGVDPAHDTKIEDTQPIDPTLADMPPIDPAVVDKPLYHLYVVRSKGKALLRVANVWTINTGEITAAWESRSTARWWGMKHTEDSGEQFRILKCDFEDCPVCKRKRAEWKENLVRFGRKDVK